MAELSRLNYLNVLAYICNAGVTYTIGANVDASIKYQTLVTPVGFAFAIWGIIFISQLIFVIIQLLPAYRSNPLVTHGIGYKYIGACLAQAAWCPAFSVYELTWLALVFMLTILFFLVMIVKDQYQLQDDTITIRDFLLLKFPFAIHCGWIAAASLISVNVVLVASNVGPTGQYVAAILSLACVVAAAGFCIGFLVPPHYVIPFVLAWAAFGIYTELGNPKDLIINTFDETRISSIRQGALVTCVLIVIALVAKIILGIVQKYRRPSLSVEEPLLRQG